MGVGGDAFHRRTSICDSTNIGINTKVERRLKQYTVSSFRKSIMKDNRDIVTCSETCRKMRHRCMNGRVLRK